MFFILAILRRDFEHLSYSIVPNPNTTSARAFIGGTVLLDLPHQTMGCKTNRAHTLGYFADWAGFGLVKIAICRLGQF